MTAIINISKGQFEEIGKKHVPLSLGKLCLHYASYEYKKSWQEGSYINNGLHRLLFSFQLMDLILRYKESLKKQCCSEL